MKTSSEELSASTFKTQPLVWALFISVVLNLFLAGAVLGVTPGIKHKPFGPAALASPHGEYMVEWVVRYLDPADADIFRNAFKTQADALKLAHEHVHQAMGNVASVFEQEQPDPEALQAATNQLNQAKSEVGDAVSKILQTAYIKLSPEGRHRLSDLAQNPL